MPIAIASKLATDLFTNTFTELFPTTIIEYCSDLQSTKAQEINISSKCV